MTATKGKERGKTYSADGEVQALEAGEVGSSHLEQASPEIFGGAGEGLVGGKSVGGNQKEGGSSVDNTSGGSKDAGLGGTVGDALVDTPVF